jgi:glycosyltransferase involved in cell wall biosynthesis
LNQACPPCEIIVVDDVSGDDTVAVVDAEMRAETRDREERAEGGNLEPEDRGTSGEWQVASGEWQVARDKWRVASGNGAGTKDQGPGTKDQGPRIRIVRRQRNGGPAAARNDGARAARGEWLAFLDADDAWLPWHLERMASVVERHPNVGLVCARTTAFDESSREEPRRDPAMVTRSVPLSNFVMENPVATSTVLLRRDAWDEAEGFDEQFRGPEDYDLWMRVAVRHPVMKLKEAHACYRSEFGSLSMDDRTFLPQVLRVLDKAFSRKGALKSFRSQRLASESNQYWNASWMAFNRGARGAAIGHWYVAWRKAMASPRPVERAWFALLLRYLVGKR